MSDNQATLSDLVVLACAQAFRDDGEIMATGIGPIPRLGTAIAKKLWNPALQTTDGECYYAEEPVAPGDRADVVEGYANYRRIFDALWGGRRHAMVGPVQIDRYGQANISVIGDQAKPKVAMLGARGFPGNSVYHPNSFFVPDHNARVFVEGEVDFVCMAGYNPDRYLNGKPPKDLDLRLIVTNLCVMDFGGPDHQIRVISLHPNVTFDEVQENTGFELGRIGDDIPQTPVPTGDELDLIARLDPHEVRHKILKDNPPLRTPG